METNIRTARLHSRSLYFTPPLRNMFLNDEGMWPPANLTRVGTREEYIKVSRRARTSSGDGWWVARQEPQKKGREVIPTATCDRCEMGTEITRSVKENILGNAHSRSVRGTVMKQ